MLIGQIFVSVIAYFLNSYYSARLIGYPTSSQVVDMLPSFVCSCLMGGGALLVGYILKLSNNFILLVTQAGLASPYIFF